MNENIENGDVVEMDEVHYGKRCYYPVIEYHPNTGSIAYEKEQLTKATYSVLIHDSNVSRVFIEKGKHFQLMRKIIESNNQLIKEKDREIEKLKEDLRLYAISVCPDKDREIADYVIGIDDLISALIPHKEDVEYKNIIESLKAIKKTAERIKSKE